MRHLLILYLLLINAFTSLAQVYPVTGTAALIPPYSVYLSDYTSGTSDRIVSTVILNDISRPDLRVRLRLRIEGQNVRLETKPEYIGSAIFLQSGVPLRLTGTDLIEYFDPSHLNFSGITRREFEKTGALPQGFYTFCIEVLEYNRGVKISNTICAPGWLILNDPPLVNLPRNGEKLKPTIPQNVVFQWTPRHTGSPNSAFNTEYDIRLVELWPATRNPNDAILTSPPILETTTRSTTYIYGPADTPLELGRHYALRIQARSIVGADELDLFKNHGYSEVITFTYGDACEMPLSLTAQSTNPSRLKISWQGQFNHTAYTLRYRQAGATTGEWFTTSTILPEAEINSLKPGTTYEYQVAGGCGVYESIFTPVATIKTKDPVVGDYSCGVATNTFNLDAAQLVATLAPGDVIRAGDFDIELVKVTGSNGTFSGTGTVVVPYLNNVKVKAEFTSITVNQEKRMVNGYLNVTGAAVDLVPDEVTAMMDDLSESLDKIEAGLDKAQDVLDDLDAAIAIADKVIEEVKTYLPDDIINEINQSRNEIAAAKDALKSAATPEAEAAAKTQLKAARQKLKDAAGKAAAFYAEAIKQFVNILIQSLKELAQEATGSKASAKQAMESSDQELSSFVTATNSQLNTGGTAGDGELIFLNETQQRLSDDEVEQLKQNSSFKEYFEKTSTFLQKLQEYNILLVIESLGKTVKSKEDVEKLAQLLKQEGVDLLKEIGTQLKERKPEREIIDYTKGEIKNSVGRVVSTIIANQP